MSPELSWLVIVSFAFSIYLGMSLLYIDSLKIKKGKNGN